MRPLALLTLSGGPQLSSHTNQSDCRGLGHGKHCPLGWALSEVTAIAAPDLTTGPTRGNREPGVRSRGGLQGQLGPGTLDRVPIAEWLGRRWYQARTREGSKCGWAPGWGRSYGWPQGEGWGQRAQTNQVGREVLSPLRFSGGHQSEVVPWVSVLGQPGSQLPRALLSSQIWRGQGRGAEWILPQGGLGPQQQLLGPVMSPHPAQGLGQHLSLCLVPWGSGRWQQKKTS